MGRPIGSGALETRRKANKMIALYRAGLTQKEIASAFGVTQAAVSYLIRRYSQGGPVTTSRRDLPTGAYRRGRRFIAMRWVRGKLHYLGYYDTPEEAHAAYLAAAHLTQELAA